MPLLMFSLLTLKLAKHFLRHRLTFLNRKRVAAVCMLFILIFSNKRVPFSCCVSRKKNRNWKWRLSSCVFLIKTWPTAGLPTRPLRNQDGDSANALSIHAGWDLNLQRYLQTQKTKKAVSWFTSIIPFWNMLLIKRSYIKRNVTIRN